MRRSEPYLGAALLAAGLLWAVANAVGQQPLATGMPVQEKEVIATSRPVAPPNLLPPALTGDSASPPVAARGVPATIASSTDKPPSPVMLTSFLSDANRKQIAETKEPPLDRQTSSPDQPATLAIQVQGPEKVVPGAPLTYTVVIRNPGPAPLCRVRIEDQLPPGAKLISADPMPQRQGDLIFWSPGVLEGHGERRLHLEIQPSGAGEVEFNPTASFSPAATVKTSYTPARFAITQVAPEQVQRGSSFPFQIEVVNNGSTVLNNVVLRAQLSPGLQHPEGNTVEAAIGSLQPGQNKTLRLDVMATLTGSLFSDVFAYGDGAVQAQARTFVRVADAPLGLKLDGPERTTIAGEAALRLEVWNPGTTPANNVHVTQMVPEGFELIPDNGKGVFDAPSRTVTWTSGELAPGQHQTIVFKARAKLPGEWKWEAAVAADRLLAARTALVTTIDAARAGP